MGKIFGISDLPVSTIMTPFEPLEVPKPEYNKVLGERFYEKGTDDVADRFISKNKNIKSNPFVRMRNGIGKLMKSFSRSVK